ncbi:synaptotagmin-5 [Phalaenopsis equestris]|uniref:synaptotagmin-5 n=1 Tax=Phalaenopsis equestris TaxID=78828 RepID=UPI0009E2F971|nr:synaptotagmin-5 [Phalaenopsis equestris]
MDRRRLKNLYAKEAVEFLNHVIEEKPLLPFLIPLGFFAWAIERWLVPFSNWIPMAFAVWATIEYGSFRRQLLIEGMNRRWKHLILHSTPVTPLEPCAWLNKLLMEVWPNYMEPKLSLKFSSMAESRLKERKPKLIEKLELQEFSLGSCPPNLGQNGVHWVTVGEQNVMRLDFEWDTNEMSVLLLAKLAKPLMGTARIVINSIYIKGDVLITPILDGQALLYSFESTPDVRIGVAFGSGNGQTLPATELPGVSTWLVKILTETLARMMVEPRRACFSLPSRDLRKKAVGGLLSVTVVSVSNLHVNSVKRNSVESPQCSLASSQSSADFGNQIEQTFIEVELGSLSRKTNFSRGSNPAWNSVFNLLMHGDSGIIRFHLYDGGPDSVKLNYLSSCEIKLKYVADDSTTFWAIGPKSGVLAKHVENCGQEVKMVIPFEDTNFGELTIRLVLKEWQFSDGSVTMSRSSNGLQSSMYGSSNLLLGTGRKLSISVVEGRSLTTKDKSGKCDPYVKLEYGKALQRTKTIYHTTTPVWNQSFEFDEIGGGEYLKIKCYNAEKFGDENIGGAKVSLEGLLEGSCRDVWIPLEKVSSGELRLQIQVTRNSGHEGHWNSPQRSFSAGWVELVLIEARDLIAADLRGTSDPYVRVHYGNLKKRTKVIYRTLNPQWNQTLEFPDTGSRLVLYVKDHNAVLPETNIGDCEVEYEMLPPNQVADKWIPLQGVRSGEIHVRVTRRIPEQQNKQKNSSQASSFSTAHEISGKMREMLKKLEGLVHEGDTESLSLSINALKSAQDAQEGYIVSLEREKTLLLNKINELGHELMRSSSSPSSSPY